MKHTTVRQPAPNQMNTNQTPAGGTVAGLSVAGGSAPSIHLADALPCPFCGSARIVKGERYFAMCVDCGATGPERNADASQRKYTRDWNTRASLPNTQDETRSANAKAGASGA